VGRGGKTRRKGPDPQAESRAGNTPRREETRNDGSYINRKGALGGSSEESKRAREHTSIAKTTGKKSHLGATRKNNAPEGGEESPLSKQSSRQIEEERKSSQRSLAEREQGGGNRRWEGSERVFFSGEEKGGSSKPLRSPLVMD